MKVGAEADSTFRPYAPTGSPRLKVYLPITVEHLAALSLHVLTVLVENGLSRGRVNSGAFALRWNILHAGVDAAIESSKLTVQLSKLSLVVFPLGSQCRDSILPACDLIVEVGADSLQFSGGLIQVVCLL